MPNEPAYDRDNIFAKILRGDLPCHRVFEDEKTLVFLDIMPRADGHALVIPKAAARTVFDIAPDDLTAVIHTVQRVAIAARAAFRADGITVNQYNEKAGGQEVPHLHFHVIPRQDGVSMKPPATAMEDRAALEENATLLREALGG